MISDRLKVGVIGLGFVGGAIHEAIRSSYIFHEVILIDPHKGLTGTYADLEGADGVFVCVPSPQDNDGTCDTSIMEEVLSQLKAVNFNGVIISKCTAPPLTYKALQKDFPNLVHAPEFLTAANAVRDYANGRFAIIGGSNSAYRNEAERIIRLTQSELKSVIHCSIQEASLAKYTINTFLATKVTFMNEIAKLAEASDCDYKTIVHLVNQDTRIGHTHMQVPGPDGALGFGGACFPKDTSALLKIAEELSVQMNVLDAAVKKNTLLRLTEPK